MNKSKTQEPLDKKINEDMDYAIKRNYLHPNCADDFKIYRGKTMKQLIYIWETEFDRLQAERFRKDIIEKERKRILEIIDLAYKTADLSIVDKTSIYMFKEILKFGVENGKD